MKPAEPTDQDRTALSPKNQKGSTLRLVAWETTRNCNLACLHCRASAAKGPHSGELDTRASRRLLDQIAKVGRPIVILTGGEPLLRPDIFEIAAYGTKKGLKIGGAKVPGKFIFIEQAKKGEEFLVEWRFRCILLPNIYYANVGVLFFNDGKREILNRLVDAIVFKVQPVPKINLSGIVHFEQKANITKIS